MNTRTIQPTVDPDRIVLVSDAEEPRPRLVPGLMALVFAIAMVLGAGIVYAWQQGELGDRDRVVQTARVEAVNAGNLTDGALARIGALQAEVTRLEATLEAQQAELDIRAGRISDAKGRLDRAQDRADRTQASLDQVQDDLAAVTGPRVVNGRHIAYLLAAGPTQSPPMMVIDLGRWFSGDAARRAATADGALTAGERLFQGRYLRNTSQDWRILPVGTGALFTIRDADGAAATNVSFTALASILNFGAIGSTQVAHNPFWVEVRQGRITGGHEQGYRAP